MVRLLAVLVLAKVSLDLHTLVLAETIVITNLNRSQSISFNTNERNGFPLHEQFELPLVGLEFSPEEYIKIEISGDPVLNTSSTFRTYQWYRGTDSVYGAWRWGSPIIGGWGYDEGLLVFGFPEINPNLFPYHDNYYAPDFYEPFYITYQVPDDWNGLHIPIKILNFFEMNKDVIVATEPPYPYGPSYALYNQNITGATDFTFFLVPEPSSLSLLLAGGAVFAAARRRKVD